MPGMIRDHRSDAIMNTLSYKTQCPLTEDTLLGSLDLGTHDPLLNNESLEMAEPRNALPLGVRERLERIQDMVAECETVRSDQGKYWCTKQLLDTEVYDLHNLLEKDQTMLELELAILRRRLQGIERPARTQAQKLAEAMDNRILRGIAAGRYCFTDGLTVSDVYADEAGLAEALAVELRRMASLTSEPTPLESPTRSGAHEAEDDYSSVNSRKFDDIVIPHTPYANERVDPVPDTATPDQSLQQQPLAVRQMPVLKQSILAHIPAGVAETFSADFLLSTLKGEEWSPGFYFIPPSQQRDSLVSVQAYYILDIDFEPFLPTQAGAHGAKLTAFFNDSTIGDTTNPDEDAYEDAPLFLSRSTASGAKEYEYLGNYTQSRYSDRLDYDNMFALVPARVNRHHAEQLCSKTRPAWLTEALMTHFWPKPSYIGPTVAGADATELAYSDPDGEGGSKRSQKQRRRIERAWREYLDELREWEKDARMRVNLLKPSDIMGAFERADADAEPGLRLWWEYLQCTGFDTEIYETLCACKNSLAGDGAARVADEDENVKVLTKGQQESKGEGKGKGRAKGKQKSVAVDKTGERVLKEKVNPEKVKTDDVIKATLPGTSQNTNPASTNKTQPSRGSHAGTQTQREQIANQIRAGATRSGASSPLPRGGRGRGRGGGSIGRGNGGSIPPEQGRSAWMAYSEKFRGKGQSVGGQRGLGRGNGRGGRG